MSGKYGVRRATKKRLAASEAANDDQWEDGIDARAEIEQYLSDHAIPWPSSYTSDEEGAA